MRRERREMHDKHYKRKVIVQEFDSFDRDEKRMREVYGAAMDLLISNFLKAILQRQQRLKLEAEGKKKKKAVARTLSNVRSESRRHLKSEASEVRQRGAINHDEEENVSEDEEDMSEDASEEAEVEAKREEDDQTLTRKRRDRSGDRVQE
ncbi:hypothetical protein CPC16_008333, partial [Podila verticillata]